MTDLWSDGPTDPAESIRDAIRALERASARPPPPPMMVLGPRVATRAIWAAGGGRRGWRGPFGTRWRDFVGDFAAAVVDDAPTPLGARLVVSVGMGDFPDDAREAARAMAQGLVESIKAQRAKDRRKARKKALRRKHGRR